MNWISRQKALGTVIAIAGILLTAVLLRELKFVLLPLALAFFLAGLLRPASRIAREMGVPASIISLLIILLTVGVIALGGIVFYISLENLLRMATQHEAEIQRLIPAVLGKLPAVINSPQIVEIIQNQFAQVAKMQIIELSNAILVFIGMLSFATVLMLFLLERENKFIGRLASTGVIEPGIEIAPIVHRIQVEIERYLVTFISFRLVTALITGSVLLIFGADQAVFWMEVTFILHFVPTIGAIISTAGPIGLALIQFESTSKAAAMAAVLIVAKGAFNSYLSPKIMGKVMHLSPTVVLISLLYWGWCWGVVGMILAVPITSMLTIVLENLPNTKALARVLKH